MYVGVYVHKCPPGPGPRFPISYPRPIAPTPDRQPPTPDPAPDTRPSLRLPVRPPTPDAKQKTIAAGPARQERAEHSETEAFGALGYPLKEKPWCHANPYKVRFVIDRAQVIVGITDQWQPHETNRAPCMMKLHVQAKPQLTEKACNDATNGLGQNALTRLARPGVATGGHNIIYYIRYDAPYTTYNKQDMYVCTYVCMYVCTYVCMYILYVRTVDKVYVLYVCICMCMYVCMYICMYIHMYMYMYVYIYICIHIYMHYMCTINMYVCMYIYVHICTYVCMYTICTIHDYHTHLCTQKIVHIQDAKPNVH